MSDRIVAVDTTSLYPAEALQQKPNVGYMRALSAEGVLGLNPSLVLAIEGAGPKETDRGAGEPRPCRWCACRTATPATASSRRSGWSPTLPAQRDRGECLAQPRSTDDLAALATLRSKITQPKKVLFVLSFSGRQADGRGPQHRGRRHHPLAGAVNAIDAYEGYKQISDEAVIAAGPDAVLVDAARARPYRRRRPCSRMRPSR